MAELRERTDWFGTNRIETASGLPYDFVDPQAADINLWDIAYNLAHLCRFGGATDPFYSVAEHSCFVANIVEARGAPRELVLAALLHDAHEAYIGDIPKPMKPLFGHTLEALADKADVVIAEHFGLDVELFKDPAVKNADRVAVDREGRKLMRHGPAGSSSPLPLPAGVSFPGGLGCGSRPRNYFLAHARKLGIDE